MKALLVIVCIALALFAGLFVFWGTAKSPEGPAQASAPSEFTQLREQLQALEKRVDALQSSTHLESSGGSRLSQSDVDAAVERALAARGAPAGPADAQSSPRGAGQAPRLDAQSAFAQLSDPALNWDERRKKWSELSKAGVLDEVLALYEKQATENPNDPKAQTALGNAYLNKLFNSPQGPEAGVWGTKADKSFDRALALDDHNWEARFTKAVSLSNWPAFLGRQPEAIEHFEILVGQQEQGAPRPEYAQTYMILGNMYFNSGEKAKAVSIWQQGLGFFPQNAELAQKLELANQH